MIRKHPVYAFICLVLLMSSHACLAGGNDPDGGILGSVEAAAKAWQLVGDGAVLVDVRSAEEFADGSLEGAVHIPHTEIDKLAEFIGDDLDRPVVLFCRSGRRSGRATEALAALGYTGVFNGTGYEAMIATKPE